MKDILKYMTPTQAEIATRGMTAQEMANLRWVLERLRADKRAAFITGMSRDDCADASRLPSNWRAVGEGEWHG